MPMRTLEANAKTSPIYFSDSAMFLNVCSGRNDQNVLGRVAEWIARNKCLYEVCESSSVVDGALSRPMAHYTSSTHELSYATRLYIISSNQSGLTMKPCGALNYSIGQK